MVSNHARNCNQSCVPYRCASPLPHKEKPHKAPFLKILKCKRNKTKQYLLSRTQTSPALATSLRASLCGTTGHTVVRLCLPLPALRAAPAAPLEEAFSACNSSSPPPLGALHGSYRDLRPRSVSLRPPLSASRVAPARTEASGERGPRSPSSLHSAMAPLCTPGTERKLNAT